MADIMLRSPFADLRRLMEEVWDGEGSSAWSFPRLSALAGVQEGALALDVEKHQGRYVVAASVPGFSRDEITVQVNEGVLTITAERSEEHDEQQRNFVRHERYAGSLMRSVSIPGIGPDSDVEARLKDGVLTVEVAVPDAQQTRQVEIQEG